MTEKSEGRRERELFEAALEQAGSGRSGDERPTEDVSGRAAAVPRQIGPYRVLECVGEGGMGAVYVAEQSKPVRRRVAIKLIKPGMESRQVLARFESERQALAMMSHPHIARILDAGTTDSSLPYFVMEYVPGMPITEYCDMRRLDLAQRLRLFLDVCSAIEHAHQRGIIHRDIKPSNVLISEEGGGPLAKVIDFGIAKATGQRLGEATAHTRLGVLMGTPEYMSPEQAEGSPLDLDTRSDVYSLGAVLYELLVGVPVLSFGRAESLAEIQRTVREVDPVAPSSRLGRMVEEAAEVATSRGTDVPTLRRRLRGDLDWITMKALEKDRGRRYAHAAELAADLRLHLEHRAVAAGPPSISYRLRKLLRRHRVASVAAGLVLLSFLVAAWGAWGWWRAARGAERAQRFGENVGSLEWRLRVAYMSPFHDLTGEYRRFETLLTEIEERMEELGRGAKAPGHYALGRGYLALDRTDESLRHLDESWRLGLRTSELAWARGVALGRVYRRAYARARAMRDPPRRQQEIAVAQMRYRDPALAALTESRSSPSAPVPYVDALIAYYEERYDDAFRQIDRALAEAPWLWEAFKLRGDVLVEQAEEHYRGNRRQMGNVTDAAAEEAYARALEVAPSAAAAHLGQCARSIYRLFRSTLNADASSGFFHLRERAQDACGSLQSVLPGHPELPTHLANLHMMTARLFILQGKDPRPELATARRHAEAAVQRQPDSASALRALGDSMLLLGRYDWERGEDARAALGKAGGLFERAAELEPSVQANNNAANAYLMKARLETTRGLDPTSSLVRAEELYRRAAELAPSDVLVQGNMTLVMRDRAAWDADHGTDPTPRLLAAAKILEAQIERAPEMVFLPVTMAGLCAEIAAALAEWGEEGTGSWLERGRAAAARAVELAPGQHGPHWSRAEVEEEASRQLAARGLDPTVPAGAALAALDRYDALFPDQGKARRRRGAVHLALARFEVAVGRSPARPLRAAAAELDAALRLQPSEASEVLLLRAELHLLELGAAGEEAAKRVLPGAVETARRLATERAGHARSLVVAARLHLWQVRLAADSVSRERAAVAARDLLGRATEINPALRSQAEEVLAALASSGG